MSYDIYLEDRNAEPWCSYGKKAGEFEDDGDGPCPAPCYPCVEVERFEEGGTYAIGGTTEAHLSMTYNYSEQLYPALPIPDEIGFTNWLTGKTGAEVLPIFEKAVEELGTRRYSDYWAPTRGNVGYALNILAGWARQYPDAVFRVS